MRRLGHHREKGKNQQSQTPGFGLCWIAIPIEAFVRPNSYALMFLKENVLYLDHNSGERRAANRPPHRQPIGVEQDRERLKWGYRWVEIVLSIGAFI
jgi:hypothetical protein